jgi:hypothetical protein
VGLFFGILLVKAEVISWFRIQEMFRFQGFHMFGIFATALPVAIISVQLIKRRGARTLSGEPVTIPPKTMGSGMRYIVGGITFGLGWALTGACPGPLFALLGSGIGVITGHHQCNGRHLGVRLPAPKAAALSVLPPATAAEVPPVRVVAVSRRVLYGPGGAAT